MIFLKVFESSFLGSFERLYCLMVRMRGNRGQPYHIPLNTIDTGFTFFKLLKLVPFCSNKWHYIGTRFNLQIVLI